MGNMNIRFKIKDTGKADILLSIVDKQESQDEIVSLTVDVVATHSGIINGNNWLYTPGGMKDGTSTFTNPIPKPVLVAHNNYGDAIGRVVSSKYSSYGLSKVSKIPEGTSDAKKLIEKIRAFTESSVFADKEYKGLGEIILTLEITDKEAIQKILDRRYMAVSISGNSDQVLCSCCGMDLRQEEGRDCMHWRGRTVDGKRVYHIAGAMTFNEVSFVNTPADEHAYVKSIQDSVRTEEDNRDNTIKEVFSTSLDIIDYKLKDTGDKPLKTLLKKFKENSKLDTDLIVALKDMGLGSHVLSTEAIESLRKTSFLFADEKILPINTPAYVLAAIKLLEEVEDDSDKSDIMEVLDRRYKRSFGEKDMATAIESLKDADQEAEAEFQTRIATLEIDKLADAVAHKLSKLVSGDDSYVSRRNATLEEDVEALEAENKLLADKLVTSTVSQIVALQKRSEDKDYIKDLGTRSQDSLADKLNDLIVSATPAASNENLDTASINDAGSSEGHDSGDDPEADPTDRADAIQDTDIAKMTAIRAQYIGILRGKGMRAARKYISDLRAKDELPKNFTL